MENLIRRLQSARLSLGNLERLLLVASRLKKLPEREVREALQESRRLRESMRVLIRDLEELRNP